MGVWSFLPSTAVIGDSDGDDGVAESRRWRVDGACRQQVGAACPLVFAGCRNEMEGRPCGREQTKVASGAWQEGWVCAWERAGNTSCTRCKRREGMIERKKESWSSFCATRLAGEKAAGRGSAAGSREKGRWLGSFSMLDLICLACFGLQGLA